MLLFHGLSYRYFLAIGNIGRSNNKGKLDVVIKRFTAFRIPFVRANNKLTLPFKQAIFLLLPFIGAVNHSNS